MLYVYGFGGVQLWFALGNRTLIDFKKFKQNPYDMGSKISNLEQVFGEISLEAFLPLKP